MYQWRGESGRTPQTMETGPPFDRENDRVDLRGTRSLAVSIARGGGSRSNTRHGRKEPNDAESDTKGLPWSECAPELLLVAKPGEDSLILGFDRLCLFGHLARCNEFLPRILAREAERSESTSRAAGPTFKGCESGVNA